MNEELVKRLRRMAPKIGGSVSDDMLEAANALTAQQEPVAYGVFNAEGFPEFIAGWEELAHEHINDAINEGGIDEAAHWVVRKLYTTPPSDVREKMPQTPCVWIMDDEEWNTWAGSCGAFWTFTEGGPSDNNFVFCPQCGRAAREEQK